MSDDLWAQPVDDETPPLEAVLSDSSVRPAGPLIVTRWQRYKYRMTSTLVEALGVVALLSIIGLGVWFYGIPSFQDWRAQAEQEQIKPEEEESQARLPSPTQLRAWHNLRVEMGKIPQLIAKADKAGLDSVESSLKVAYSLGERGLALANPLEVGEVSKSVGSAVRQGEDAIKEYEAEVEAKRKAAEEEEAKRKAAEKAAKEAAEEAERKAYEQAERDHNYQSPAPSTPINPGYVEPSPTPSPAPTPPPSQKVSTSQTVGSCPAGTTVTFTATGGGTVTISAGGRTASGSGSTSLTLTISGSVTATATASGSLSLSYSANENC